MTHSELAKALKLSRPTISRDVAKGMPLDIKGAKEWREENKEFKGEKTGPKPKIDYDDDDEPQLPNWLRLESKEIRLAEQIHKATGEKLNALREEYDKIARLVQANDLYRIDRAINRRFWATHGDPDDCFESFVKELAELAAKWKKDLDTKDDDEA